PANASLRIGFPLLLPALVLVDGINCHDFVQEVAEVYREVFSRLLRQPSPRRVLPRGYRAGRHPLVTRKLEGTEPSCSVFPVLRSVFSVPGSPFPVRSNHPPTGSPSWRLSRHRRDRGRSRPPPRNVAHLAID